MICFLVLFDRLVNDILRKIIIAVRICLQPVTDELLVEGRLAMARLISLERPEAAGVGCEHFVAEDDISVFVQTELELGIGDDDPAGERVIRALLVECDRAVAELLGVFDAVSGELLFQNVDALLKADIFIVVADFSLCARCVDRLRQFVALL